MPKLVNSQPKYRRHRPSGQAVVTLNGKQCYLGRHGTQASRHEYDRLVAEWMAHGRSLSPSRVDSGISVNQMLVAYLRWAKGYYQGSREIELMKLAVRPLKELNGGSPAGEFGPLALKAVRQRMIDADLCRNECK